MLPHFIIVKDSNDKDVALNVNHIVSMTECDDGCVNIKDTNGDKFSLDTDNLECPVYEAVGHIAREASEDISSWHDGKVSYNPYGVSIDSPVCIEGHIETDITNVVSIEQ